MLFLGLLRITRDHKKLDFVYLLSVRIGHPFDYSALLEVPENQGAIFWARRHESVALADLDVDYDVQMAVQRGLEDHWVLAPDFDDSKVHKGDEYKKCWNLPVICACNDKFVLEVKLDIVHGSPAAVWDVGVGKHSLHALELAIIVV